MGTLTKVGLLILLLWILGMIFGVFVGAAKLLVLVGLALILIDALTGRTRV